MKTFADTCAQGDVHFMRRGALPAGLVEVPAIKGRVVVTHSETGHDHVMLLDRSDNPDPAVVMYGTDDPLVAWLQVNRPTALDHLRPHDTHESIMFEPGIYEVRRQREYDPMEKIARQVED
jgi:hypothetical protein